MYSLIFTCLNLRSTRVDIVLGMNTPEFIQALIRFYNIYDTFSHLYNDNARSFSATLKGNLLKHHVDSNVFDKRFGNCSTKHVRISLYSPWVSST